MLPSGRGLCGRCHHRLARIFDWGTQMTCNDVFKHFQNEKLFKGHRYRKMEDQKSWPGLSRNQNFAEGGGLEVNVEKLKCLNWETW